jgi:hypothetical protein
MHYPARQWCTSVIERRFIERGARHHTPCVRPCRADLCRPRPHRDVPSGAPCHPGHTPRQLPPKGKVKWHPRLWPRGTGASLPRTHRPSSIPSRSPAEPPRHSCTHYWGFTYVWCTVSHTPISPIRDRTTQATARPRRPHTGGTVGIQCHRLATVLPSGGRARVRSGV